MTDKPKLKDMNPVEQLGIWIEDETIGIREFSILYRNWMRRKHKNTFGGILGGTNEGDSGLMGRMFQVLAELEGSFELQHLRDKY